MIADSTKPRRKTAVSNRDMSAVGVVGGESGELALDADQFGAGAALLVAVVGQPVGVDEPGGVVVGRFADRPQECGFEVHRRPLSSTVLSGPLSAGDKASGALA